MQARVGQVDAANTRKREIKNSEDKQKTESASAKHSAGTYEFGWHDVPRFEIAFPFVHFPVLCGSPHLAVQTKMALARRLRHFSTCNSRIAN